MQYRCAVYTRKSHEEGLEQDFNSLDAQYEACKAYIASQASLEWKLRDGRYDDGGISGGHMDRPALQDLITDIKAGLIDVIVVYKVDRLTRSLTDFARLVEIFDEHDVSFVSVTQSFNTTTSMGRLTLNVLLSFAQFEREVTAERIRDKFAASKKKGIWMGGTCPIGYRHEDRKLHIVDDEAKIIRFLYQLYIDVKNVRLVKAEADRRGYISRLRLTRSGKQTGGIPFSRGHIYRILSNPVYNGKIQHKDKVYDGQHDAIIPKDLWDQVQAIKDGNAINRKITGNSKSNTLLAGLLFDNQHNKLVPHHANNKGKRYSYYVSQKLKTGDQDSGWRIPAPMIEQTAKDVLTSTLASKSNLLSLLSLDNLTADQVQHIVKTGKSIGQQIENCNHLEAKTLLNAMIETIELRTDQIRIIFDTRYISKEFGLALSNDTNVHFTRPMTIRRRGQEMKIVIRGDDPKTVNHDPGLIKLIARANALRTGLENGSVGSIKAFAQNHNIDHADAKRMLPLGYLAPDIVEAILGGYQPEDLTALILKNGYSLPYLWSEHRAYLGFPA